MATSEQVKESFLRLKAAVEDFRKTVGDDGWVVSGLSMLRRDMRFIENIVRTFGVNLEKGEGVNG